MSWLKNNIWTVLLAIVCAGVCVVGVMKRMEINADAEKWRNFQKGITTTPCEWKGTQDVESSER